MEKVKIILSPSKNVNLFVKQFNDNLSSPIYEEDANFLVKIIQTCSDSELKTIFNSSFSIIEENRDRYNRWFKNETKFPCAFLFKGEAYRYLDIKSFTQDELNYLQEHLIILSALYGVLKPLDLIKAYRLEMGSKLIKNKFPFQSMYDFWREKITVYFNNMNLSCLINLASEEYSKVIDYKKLNCRVLQVSFKEFKNDKFSIISIYAKQARGEMLKFISKRQLRNIEDIILFDSLSYSFNEALSDDNHYVFTR